MGDVEQRDVEGNIFLRMDGELMEEEEEEEEEGGLVSGKAWSVLSGFTSGHGDGDGNVDGASNLILPSSCDH